MHPCTTSTQLQRHSGIRICAAARYATVFGFFHSRAAIETLRPTYRRPTFGACRFARPHTKQADTALHPRLRGAQRAFQWIPTQEVASAAASAAGATRIGHRTITSLSSRRDRAQNKPAHVRASGATPAKPTRFDETSQVPFFTGCCRSPRRHRNVRCRSLFPATSPTSAIPRRLSRSSRSAERNT